MFSQYVSSLKSTRIFSVLKFVDPQSVNAAISCHAAWTGCMRTEEKSAATVKKDKRKEVGVRGRRRCRSRSCCRRRRRSLDTAIILTFWSPVFQETNVLVDNINTTLFPCFRSFARTLVGRSSFLVCSLRPGLPPVSFRPISFCKFMINK